MNEVIQWGLSLLEEGEAIINNNAVCKALKLSGAPFNLNATVKLTPLVNIFSEIILPNSKYPDHQKTWFAPETLNTQHICYPHAQRPKPKLLKPSPGEMTAAQSNTQAALVCLEKYGTYQGISSGEDDSHLPLFDTIKTAASIADALKVGAKEAPFLWVSADFSGIQDFVYTISSKGALKTLRARSFWLEMLSKHIIEELLSAARCQQYHIVFAGGGGFVLLLPNQPEIDKTVNDYRIKINKWLFSLTSGKLFLAMDVCAIEQYVLSDTQKISELRKKVDTHLEQQKLTRFDFLIDEGLFTPSPPEQTSNNVNAVPNMQECAICHRDDVKTEAEGDMQYLPDNNTVACPLCHSLYHLGDDLCEKDIAVYCLESKPKNKKGTFNFPGLGGKDYHYIVSTENPGTYNRKWLINNWDISGYDENTRLLCYANYVRSIDDLHEAGQEIEQQLWDEAHGYSLKKDSFKKFTASFSGLAASGNGATHIGALRMDVDNLGLIFELGLSGRLNIVTLAMLSRFMELFFKVYLQEICRGNTGHRVPVLDFMGNNYFDATPQGRQVSIVYAGGDDLFIVGAWSQIAELSYDIYRCFREYTGKNSNVTLSGGVTLHRQNFPLYQIARLSGEAEQKAKESDNLSNLLEKDGVVFFYHSQLPVEQRRIKKHISQQQNSGVLPKEVECGKRLEIKMHWNEFNTLIEKPIRWFLDFEDKTAPPTPRKARHLQFVPEFPNGITYKMLRILQDYYNNGMLSLPKQVWLAEKLGAVSQAAKRKKMDLQIEFLQLFREPTINYLYIPLTWVEFLSRGAEHE